MKAFREVGYVADLASDGEEGLALAESGDYDVLVVDRMLPKRDGLSLIGALRENGNRTPVLILSALGQVDDRVKGLRAGGDDYLPKPYCLRRTAGARRSAVAPQRRPEPRKPATASATSSSTVCSHRVTRAASDDRRCSRANSACSNI